jgi:hydroxymethylglutaryl-CoA lyase
MSQPGRRVRVFEVGPRDGLQNEAKVLSLEERIELVERLCDAGVTDVEIGAFVHPKWVPQMAGTDELARSLGPREGVRFWALVPNLRGLERAHESGVRHVCLLASATESHSRKNLNRGIEEGLALNRELAREAQRLGATMRGYVSTAFGCPYEGEVSFDRVVELCAALFDMGVDEVSVGDTIGSGSPTAVREAARRCLERFDADRVAFHLHDTRGLGLANIFAALEEGIRIVDAAVGGTGGCPYAPGASGNLATDDLVHLLDTMGFDTGIDLDALSATTSWLTERLGVRSRSRYHEWASSRAGGE